MVPDEIFRIVNIISGFGIKKVKLTGGEPLMLYNLPSIVKKISNLTSVSEISMTTNGTFLSGQAAKLKEAGLARVNVSLDTLRAEKYETITGTDLLEEVIEGLKEAVRVGLSPVKVNMVLLRNVNDDQIWEMVDFIKDNGLILQLIELESSNENAIFKKYHLDLMSIEDELEKKSEHVLIRNMHHRKVYCLSEAAKVEVVRPMHNTEFCKYCNRMRITSDGEFKPCLFRSDQLIDFLGPMREGASDKQLGELFLKAVNERQPYFV
jgi:cyclic pyranopterin phosphate synthase